MTFNFCFLDKTLQFGATEIAKEYNFSQGNDVKVTAYKTDKLVVEVKDGEIAIGYNNKHEFYRGLLKGLNQKPCEEKAKFTHITYMNDCSRCAVPTVETVKRLIRILAVSGYDRLQLYTEDVYKIDNRP